ncbi:DegV family protein [Bacillus marinisedimentorum]|uniref:DegV family protein n=1 Tax=Bacillus marinisedimentorum TaxID=1821260 RepID=UPI000873239A|nr:DegV family protein [Bacillus marinisedimentorum]
MAIKLITDGSCDLPHDIFEKYDIEVVSLTVSFGDRHFKTGTEIDSQTFYRMMREEEDFPRSASPSPQDFLDVFNKTAPEDEILVLALSNALSSTYDSSMMARQMFLDEHGGRRVEVFNTNSASAGLALLVYETALEIEDGLGMDAIVASVEERIDDTNTAFVLDTLENVIKGGRLDRVRGAIAKTLNIKLLMRANEAGELDVTEKVRGNKKAMRRFVEQIGEYGKNFEKKVLALAHSNCEEKARAIVEEIQKQYNFKEVIISEIGPLIGTYAGEGGLVIGYRKK